MLLAVRIHLEVLNATVSRDSPDSTVKKVGTINILSIFLSFSCFPFSYFSIVTASTFLPKSTKFQNHRYYRPFWQKPRNNAFFARKFSLLIFTKKRKIPATIYLWEKNVCQNLQRHFSYIKKRHFCGNFQGQFRCDILAVKENLCVEISCDILAVRENCLWKFPRTF